MGFPPLGLLVGPCGPSGHRRREEKGRAEAKMQEEETRVKGWREEGKERKHEGFVPKGKAATDSGRLSIVHSSLFYERRGNGGFKERRECRRMREERERMLERET